jgi:hypothetical protein
VTGVPFFHQTVTLETRLSPAEVELRLQRMVRRPRTLREVLQRVPKGPPEHPDFIGTVGNGRFKLSRLADVPSSVGRFHSERPWLRGSITPSAGGSELKISFSDPGFSLLAVGLSMGISVVILAITGGWPPWRLEHAIIAAAVAIALWACRFSLRQDVEESMQLIRSCLSKGR